MNVENIEKSLENEKKTVIDSSNCRNNPNSMVAIKNLEKNKIWDGCNNEFSDKKNKPISLITDKHFEFNGPIMNKDKSNNMQYQHQYHQNIVESCKDKSIKGKKSNFLIKKAPSINNNKANMIYSLQERENPDLSNMNEDDFQLQREASL